MSSGMSAKDIVDKYALGSDKKRSGRKESFRSRETTPPWRPQKASSADGKSYAHGLSGDNSRWQDMEKRFSSGSPSAPSKTIPGPAAAHAAQQSAAVSAKKITLPKFNPQVRMPWSKT